MTPTMTICVATSNPGKAREFARLLPASVRVVTLAEVGGTSPEEDGDTFRENALLKARAAAPFADAALADDSGLVVDALQGAPGVYSARYGGDGLTDADRVQLLLSNMASVADDARTARFVSAAAFVSGDITIVVEGTVEGTIGYAPQGEHGFGYDPIFIIADAEAGDANGQTMAQLEVHVKNAISHRGRAYRTLLGELRAQGVVTIPA